AAYGNTQHHQGFLQWLTAHSPDSHFSFNPIRDAALTIRGTFRLILGGKLSEFPHDAVSILALVSLAIALIVFIRSKPRLPLIQPGAQWLIWTAAYLVFLFFWMPQNTFYRLFYLPPLIALFRIPKHATVLTFIPVLTLWNFTFEIYPQSRPQANASLNFALAHRSDWQAGTPVVYHTFHPDLWTISYFDSQAAWVGIDDANPNRLEQLLQYARRERTELWFEATAYDLLMANAQARAWLASNGPVHLLEYKDEKHDFRFYHLR
ncbi:MAG: hypothetical protein JO022_07170, partial [Acidobacteriaceae bacterium]|nr:hypothetical protein [Acidobacteriaceae bacterium]